MKISSRIISNSKIKIDRFFDLKYFLLPTFSILLSLPQPIFSQTAELQLPEIVSGEVLESIKGSTVTRSLTSGGSSSLSFGSSTSFGVSASANGTTGTKTESTSDFRFRNDLNTNNDSCSSGSCLRNTIGGTDGKITAKISNIRANNLDSYNDTLIESSSNNFSNGDADITGIQSDNTILIDGTTTQLKANTATIHSGDATDFSEINTANVISEESQTSSSNSSAFTNSNTNVDISVSEFTNSFQQAF